jgi:hypothetical protein
MPLRESSTNTAVAENIKTLIEEGKPLQQAIAIALEVQKRAKEKEKSERKK